MPNFLSDMVLIKTSGATTLESILSEVDIMVSLLDRLAAERRFRSSCGVERFALSGCHDSFTPRPQSATINAYIILSASVRMTTRPIQRA